MKQLIASFIVVLLSTSALISTKSADAGKPHFRQLGLAIHNYDPAQWEPDDLSAEEAEQFERELAQLELELALLEMDEEELWLLESSLSDEELFLLHELLMDDSGR